MKDQKNSNKMLLTTALLAVIGANYSFQVSSLKLQDSGMFEMAQIATEAAAKPEAKASDAASKPKLADSQPVAAKAPKAASTHPKETSAKKTADQAAAPATEATSNSKGNDTVDCTTGECADVANGIKVVLKMTNELKSLLAPKPAEAVATSPQAPATPAVAAQVEVKLAAEVDECALSEIAENAAKPTREEKKEREECLLNAKTEKLEEAFKTAMDRLGDRCKDDIKCLVDGFSSEVEKSKYYGKGRKEILSPTFVKNEFKNLAGAKLAKKLNNLDLSNEESLSETRELLASVLDGITNKYDLKKLTLDSLKTHVTTRAKSIFDLRTQKMAALKAKNSTAFELAQNQENTETVESRALIHTISGAAQDADFSGDSTVFKYYTSQFMPSLKKMFIAINTPMVKDTDGNLVSAEDTKSENTTKTRTTTTRGSNAGLIPSSRGQESTSFTINGQGTAWTPTVSNNGVKVGQPSFTPTIGNRVNGGTTATPTSTRQGSSTIATPDF